MIELNLKKDEYPLWDGTKITVLDVLGREAAFSKEEYNRNVFRIDAQGKTIWRVAFHYGVHGYDPFVDIRLENESIIGFTFEGWQFQISVGDGGLTKIGWSK